MKKIYEKKKGLGFFCSFFPPSSLSFFPCISSPETPVSKILATKIKNCWKRGWYGREKEVGSDGWMDYMIDA